MTKNCDSSVLTCVFSLEAMSMSSFILSNSSTVFSARGTGFK